MTFALRWTGPCRCVQRNVAVWTGEATLPWCKLAGRQAHCAQQNASISWLPPYVGRHRLWEWSWLTNRRLFPFRGCLIDDNNPSRNLRRNRSLEVPPCGNEISAKHRGPKFHRSVIYQNYHWKVIEINRF